MDAKVDSTADIEMKLKSSSTGKDNEASSSTSAETKASDEQQSNATGNNKQQTDSATGENPPAPPKRDYAVEKAETQGNEVEYASVKKQRKKIISFPPRPEFIYKPEHSKVSMACLKTSLVVFNLLIWLFGAILTALGIWINVDKEFWNIQENLDVKQFSSASYVLIVVGIIIMLVGFLGCYGAMASKIWMLVIFSIILIIVILMDIAIMAVVWSAVSNKNMQEEVKLRAKTAMHQMVDNDAKRYFIDLLQTKLQCCGVDGPNDYSVDPANPKPIPESCTNKDTGTANTRGCYDAVVEFLKTKAAIVGGVAVVVFLLQIAVLIFTLCLICSIKNAATDVIF